MSLVQAHNDTPILRFIAQDNKKYDDEKYCNCVYEGPEEYREEVLAEKKKLLDSFFQTRDEQLQRRLNRDRRKGDGDADPVRLYDARSGSFGSILGAVSGLVPLERGPKEEPLPVRVEVHLRSRLDDDTNCFLSLLLFGRDFRSIDESILSGKEDATLDAMLFLKYQKHMLVMERKGYFRQYQSFRKNDARPKGTLDVPAHLRSNLGWRGGRIASRYREFSADNPLNRLIVHTYRTMHRKYPQFVESSVAASPSVRTAVQELQSRFMGEQENLRALLKANLRPITHPFYQEFEQLRQTCIQILRKETDSMFGTQHDGEGVSGALFYAPDYWEMFLERSFMRLRGFKVTMQAEERLFGPGYKQLGLPDILFSDRDSGEAVAILDAKYKPGWNQAASGGKLGSGEYGLLSDFDKCIRDMVASNVQMTGVIYPCQEGAPQVPLTHRVSRNNDSALFYTFAVPVPVRRAGESYNGWHARFDAGLDAVIVQVQAALEREADFLREGRKHLKALAELRSFAEETEEFGEAEEAEGEAT